MKRNAIVRICIYSLLILVLLSLLGTVLFGVNFKKHYTDEIVLKPTMLETTPDGEVLRDQNINSSNIEATCVSGDDIIPLYIGNPMTAVALERLNVRSSPSEMASVLLSLAPAEEVEIDEVQSVNGIDWGHITTPVTGWVCMGYVDVVEPAATEAAAEPAASEDGTPIETAPPFVGGTFAAKERVNVRSSPSKTASVLLSLAPAEEVEIDEVQSVNGIDWGHITTPVTGWVCMEYVEVEQLAETEAAAEPTVSEDGTPIATAPPVVGGTFFPADKVSKISIDWATGDVTILRGNTKEINVKEDAPAKAKPMICTLKDGGKLNIQIQENIRVLGFNLGNNLVSKDLTITVPMDFDLGELELDMASGNVKLVDLTVGELDLDCADINMTLENCTVRSLDLDAASIKVRFNGSLEELIMDSASATFEGVFQNNPRYMDVDGMSNELNVTLPEDCGFTVTIDGMSNRFSSDYPTTSANGAYVYGNGSCRIDVDGMSASVNIHRG